MNGDKMNIIPQPYKYMSLSGKFTISDGSFFYCADELREQAERFAALVSQCGAVITRTDDISKAEVCFNVPEEGLVASEGYVVKCSGGLLTVEADKGASAFYAVETLRCIFRLDENPSEISCDNCYITDKPRYPYRGLHLDIARHFFGAEEIKRIIDLMSSVKLNKLHLHISDDQGFRVEISRYPKLNEISSFRSGTEKRSDGRVYTDEERCGGFLTKEEVKDIVDYAAARYVDVIPELDLPGHFVAILAAYPQYSCTGTVAEVRKKWGISKDLLCAGNEEGYDFVCGILDEICQMFPFEYVHLGGDEAPKDRWCNCKKCKAKLTELGLRNFDELQSYLFDRFRAYLEGKGRKVIGWNDGIDGGTHPDVVSQVWFPGSRREGLKSLNNGRKTIMSPFFTLYFDYPYAMTPLRKTYSFKPLRGVKKEARENMLGVEGAVWTEFIADAEKLYFNLLPRLLALSECAWGANNNYRDFRRRGEEYCSVYGAKGLTYNKSAFKPVNIFRRGDTVRKFFTKDADIELKMQRQKQTATDNTTEKTEK